MLGRRRRSRLRGPGPFRRVFVLGTGLASAWLGTAPAWAERESGLALAAEGRCRPALDELRADAGFASDAEVLLVIGTCESRLGRYAPALDALSRAREIDPKLPGIDLRLAIARFHMNDLAGASAALDRAEAESSGALGGEVLLYRGLITLSEDTGEESARNAARLFAAARRADPKTAEPAASYYEGVALQRAGDADGAAQAWSRVSRDWPGTSWDADARRALERPALPPARWLIVQGGFEYDDNVLLRGSGVVLPSEISSERDVRGIWSVDGGAELLRNEDWIAGIRATYFGRAHSDLSDFDTQYPTISAWVDRHLTGQTWLRAQARFGYAWVDNNPFLSTHEGQLAVVREWHEGRSRASAGVEFYRDNFLFSEDDVPDGRGVAFSPCPSGSDLICAPPGIDESRERNRDGNGLRLRFGGTWTPGEARPELRLEYVFHRFSARGSEYSFDAHEVLAATRVPLPLQFVLGLEARYAYRPYRNSTTFPSTDALFLNREYPLPERRRRENTLETVISLERAIAPRTTLSVYWRYSRNRSSEDVFDFRRNVVGALVTVSLGRR